MTITKSMESLRREMEELNTRKESLNREIEEASRQQMRPTCEMEHWLLQVRALEGRVKEVYDDEHERLNRWALWPHLRSKYRISKEAAELARDAHDLRLRVLDQVVERTARSIKDLLILSVVDGSRDGLLQQLVRCVAGEAVGIIGVHGMGGIGKTDLLTKLNAILKMARDQRGIDESGVENHPLYFDVVMMIAVPEDAGVEQVQRLVWDDLGLGPWEESACLDDRASCIFQILSKKTFVVLLDDVWESLHLPSVGIPCPRVQSSSKVVLATRLLNVCAEMRAQLVLKVEPLPFDEAWNLFQEKVGGGIRPDQAVNAAKSIVYRCGGLPLALVTVGLALAGGKESWEWSRTHNALENSPLDIPGMGDVLKSLKRSYDHLGTDKLRECFLQFAFFPKEFPVDDLEIIEYWVGEGIIDGFYNIAEASGMGHHIITTLEASSLVVERGDKIKLHRVVHTMALWIASEWTEETKKWLLVSGESKFNNIPDAEKWRTAERISLVMMHENKIQRCPEEPHAPHLLSLVLSYNVTLRKLPRALFKHMPLLKLLDLSCSSLEELPTEVGMLTALQYLNLSYTKLISLPQEIQHLVNLRYLNLNSVPTLEIFPGGVIRAMAGNLQILRMFGSYKNWMEGEIQSDSSIQEDQIEELHWLNQPKVIELSISTSRTLQKLLLSKIELPVLTLDIYGYQGESIEFSTTTWNDAESVGMLGIIRIRDSDELERIEFIGSAAVNPSEALKNITLERLENVRLAWTGTKPQEFLRSVNKLEVTKCPQIEVLIGGHGDSNGEEETESGEEEREEGVLPSLQEMHLTDMPELTTVCERVLMFPSLRTLRVERCPALRKLPFGMSSGAKLEEIRGEKEWWEELEWDNPIVKARFASLFKEI